MNFNLNAAKALLGAAVVAGAVTAISQPASAISFNTSAGTTSSFSGVTTVGFEGASPAPANGSSVSANGYTENGITYTGGAIALGSQPNQFKAPGTDSGTPDTTNYLTLGGNAGNPVTIVFSKLKGYFGLYLGSIDSYNTISFFKGASQVGSFTGTDIATKSVALGGLGLAALEGNYNKDSYVNFFGDNNSDLFNKVVLTSSSAAFESDNHAFRTDIPTPALLPGLIGMGVAAWRKRRGESAEQAEA